MPVFHSYHVRNETRMSSVAVRKGMNHYQFMMEADSALIHIVRLVFQPIRCIAQELRKSFANFNDRDAEILVCFPICARPLPCLVKHSCMKFANVFFIRRLRSGNLTVAERPLAGAPDVVALPFVQLFASGQAGGEGCFFLWRERRICFGHWIVEHSEFLTLFHHALC